MKNHILTIYESKHGCVVFDDESRGLVEEELIRGADVLARALAKRFGGFPCDFVFGGKFGPRPVELEFVRLLDGGVEYQVHGEAPSFYEGLSEGLQVWFCPSFFRYFRKAPQAFYITAVGRWPASHTSEGRS
jgi:hypothetical protein